MGLGRAFVRPRQGVPETRAITEFAIIDGVAVDGSGEIGSRYRGGMSVPGAWRASLLISDLIGQLPWDAYRRRPGGPVEKLDPTPPLLESPAAGTETRMSVFGNWGLDLLWNGNAVGVVAARSTTGYPTAVYPVPAAQVGVRRVTENSFSPLPIGTVEYNIGGLSLAPWQVLHIKGPCEPGSLRGMGVLEHHMTGGAIGLAMEQMRQAQAVANHGVPTGFLKDSNPDTTAEEMAGNKAAWLKAQRDRTVAMLNANLDFKPLSWNPDEMQMVEGRKFSLTDLELIFGLPVGWLGGQQTSRTYSNVEQDAVNLIKFTLSGHLARFEQTLSQAFPRGTTVKANLDSLLRADTLTRYQSHEIALRNRFATINQVRALENEPPVPWGDEPAETAPPVLGGAREEDRDGEA